MKEVAMTVVVAVLAFAVSVWIAMLSLGAAHAADGRIPALGWLPTFWLALALVSIVGTASASGSR
jgi:hypothetical protein